MKEYIEREALMGKQWECRTLKVDGVEYADLRDIADYIAEFPAADVVERKRGEWEVHPQDDFAREHHCEKLRCKHCWHFFYRNYGDSKLYCPNCGADMREVRP